MNLPPACGFMLSPASGSVPAGGGSGSLNVQTQGSCSWTATTLENWITLSGTAGTGPGAVSYSATANSSANPRTGIIRVANQSFTVTQGGATCSYSLSPASRAFAANGGTGSVGVRAPGDCAWTVVNNNPEFVTVTFVSSGNGNGTVNYAVAAQADPARRTGTLTIAGQSFSVLQGAHFNDVADDGSLLSTSIGKLSALGITGGCGSGNYCPAEPVTRGQMAIFLERAMRGSAFVPPAAGCASGQTSDFADVACPGLLADFIVQLFHDGITSGCGAGNYCPGSAVTRAQMAVFLERAVRGASFVPPPASCVNGQASDFADVSCPDFFADFIEQLFHDQITGGCGGGNYCPAAPVTRGQMAIFLVRAFGW